MASDRQLAANRRNALLSTGPKTRAGKNRSRRNALRHGLVAQTLIGALEDQKEYKSFERAVIASYASANPVAQHLACRLASLLWRLRRATAIETGLFSIQANILHERRQSPVIPPDGVTQTVQFLLAAAHQQSLRNDPVKESNVANSNERTAAQCFLRVSQINNEVFERIGRYEAMLWRQVAQTMLLLHSPR